MISFLKQITIISAILGLFFAMVVFAMVVFGAKYSDDHPTPQNHVVCKSSSDGSVITSGMGTWSYSRDASAWINYETNPDEVFNGRNGDTCGVH